MIELPEVRKMPPLPFQGNKACGRKKFLEFLCKIVDGDEKIFVDLFGGSFYLSYLVHKIFPKATVICNDFDNYMERLKNIHTTNLLVDKVRKILEGSPIMKRVSDEVKIKIDNFLNNEKGYIDWITLSASLLYSSQYTTEKDKFLSRVYWNHMVKRHYHEDIDEYIEGIEFVRSDWLDLFNQYKDVENVIFLADPPYHKTNKSGYVGKKWELSDSLKTLDILKTNSFAYYTSTKSGLVDIIEYMKDEGLELNDYETFVYKRAKISQETLENKEIILYRFDEYVDEEEEEEEFYEEEDK